MKDEILFDLRHVGKRYATARSAIARLWDRGATTALEDISLTVRAGDALAIVGESGSGKTTLARLMVMLQEPTSGTLRYRGVDLSHPTSGQLRDFRQRVQMVFQSTHASLNPRKTIATMVEESQGDLPTRLALREVLEMVRLPLSVADKLPHELSGGQRQRVGIARAIARKPELLIADEPTSALDVSLQREVLQLLRELHRDAGLTLVVISHDLAMVGSLCDSIAVLHGGRMVEHASAREVLYRPRQAYTRQLIAAIPRGLARRPVVVA
ncbi:MAG TPA: ATP-binding cassette domain-containing protein [Burkholderiaceae bacterium]|nr:ATP-binding cassette domain-containing protein [Burkholderiaceae bacterium]